MPASAGMTEEGNVMLTHRASALFSPSSRRNRRLPTHHVISTQVGIHASFGARSFDDNTHDQQPSDESPTSSVEQGAPGVDAGLRRHDGKGQRHANAPRGRPFLTVIPTQVGIHASFGL